MRQGDTPVPIPNTMVKTLTADDTMLGTAWESRWLPEHVYNIQGMIYNIDLSESLVCTLKTT